MIDLLIYIWGAILLIALIVGIIYSVVVPHKRNFSIKEDSNEDLMKFLMSKPLAHTKPTAFARANPHIARNAIKDMDEIDKEILNITNHSC